MRVLFIGLLLLCVLISPAAVAPACAAGTATEYCEYSGDMDGVGIIRMSLVRDADGSLHGVYFYKKWLKDILVAGQYTGERDIILGEQGAKGVFRLHFEDRDPRGRFGGSILDEEVMTGTWTGKDGQQHAVYLGMTGITVVPDGKGRYAACGADDAAAYEDNAQGFYFAVLKGDRHLAARFVSYPLTFWHEGERKQVWNASAFLRYWDTIFTPEFVAQIREGIPHNMFCNAQGAMIANGAVWFDAWGKAFVFNN